MLLFLPHTQHFPLRLVGAIFENYGYRLESLELDLDATEMTVVCRRLVLLSLGDFLLYYLFPGSTLESSILYVLSLV